MINNLKNRKNLVLPFCVFPILSFIFVEVSINTIKPLSITVDTISLQFFSIIIAISIGFITLIVGIFNILYDLIIKLSSTLNVEEKKLHEYLLSLKEVKSELKDNVAFLALLLVINILMVLFRDASFLQYQWPFSYQYFSKDAILTTILVWTILSGLYTLWDTIMGTFTLYEHYSFINEYRLKHKNHENPNKRKWT